MLIASDSADVTVTNRRANSPRPVIDTLTAWWGTKIHGAAPSAAPTHTEAITRVADDSGARRDALAEQAMS